jgi:hypothetical protein
VPGLGRGLLALALLSADILDGTPVAEAEYGPYADRSPEGRRQQSPL